MSQRTQPEHEMVALLAETAEDIKPDTNLWPRIQERLMPPTHQQSAPLAIASLPDNTSRDFATRPRRVPSRGRIIIGAALVAVLALAALTYARPLVLSWFGDASLKAIAIKDATPINQSVTVNGVTLHVQEGYADAARTVLTFEMTGPSAKESLSYFTFVLTDTQQHTYRSFTGSQFNEQAFYEFAPLPEQELNAPQVLTLTAQEMQKSDTGEALVGSPWQLTFTIRPQAGRSVSLAESTIPQTHSGVTIQPERLVLAPTGARLQIRLSGLPPDTTLFRLLDFATHGDDIVACKPGGGSCGGATSQGYGEPLEMRGPDGQKLLPAWIGVMDPSSDTELWPKAGQVVGPSGTAVIEVLFLTPLRANHGTAHLTIGAVDTSPAGATDRTATGPWEFDLPLA